MPYPIPTEQDLLARYRQPRQPRQLPPWMNQQRRQIPPWLTQYMQGGQWPTTPPTDRMFPQLPFPAQAPPFLQRIQQLMQRFGQ